MGNCGRALYKRSTTYEVEYASGVGSLNSWKGESGLWGVYVRVARTIPPPYLFVFDDRTSEVWKTLAAQIWIAQSSRDENSGIIKETLLDWKVPTLMSEKKR